MPSVSVRRTLLTSLFASLTLASVASAAPITLTFEDLAVGATLSNQYAGLGVTFSPNAFSGPGSSSSGEPWATNSDMTIVSSTGPDVGGLGTPGLVSGNILRSFSGWLDEDGDPSFSADFAAGATNFSATFAGVATGADVRLFIFNGATFITTVAGSATGQFTLGYNGGPFTRVVISPGSFNDWVGVDDITFTTNDAAAVPEPTSLVLLGTGVALAILAQRRRARLT